MRIPAQVAAIISFVGACNRDLKSGCDWRTKVKVGPRITRERNRECGRAPNNHFEQASHRCGFDATDGCSNDGDCKLIMQFKAPKVQQPANL